MGEGERGSSCMNVCIEGLFMLINWCVFLGGCVDTEVYVCINLFWVYDYGCFLCVSVVL